MNTELLKMVFEAMSYGNAQNRELARLAVGAALAEQPAPVQEHVADGLIRQYINSLVLNKPDEAANVTKAMVDYVYTTPQAQPAREPLTHDELADLWYKQSLDYMEFARAIEAAHGIKEKNT